LDDIRLRIYVGFVERWCRVVAEGWHVVIPGRRTRWSFVWLAYLDEMLSLAESVSWKRVRQTLAVGGSLYSDACALFFFYTVCVREKLISG
jgi:hypothetical protein